MKIKTNDLIGLALDRAVAIAQHMNWVDDMLLVEGPYDAETGRTTFYGYYPSVDWSQGGPIIEREGIRTEPEAVSATGFKSWRADIPKGPVSPHGYIWTFGPTPLVAAMRCFVASRLGAEVEVPDELMET